MAIGWGRILSYSCLLTWLRLEVCLSFNTLSPYIYILTGDNHTHHIRSAIMQSATRDIMANKHIHFKMSAYSYQHTKSSSSLHERWVGLLRFVGEIKPEEVLIWNWWLGIIWFLICICNAAAASALAYNHVHHISPGQKSIRASVIARKTVLKIRVTWCIFIFLSQSLPHCANCKGKLG